MNKLLDFLLLLLAQFAGGPGPEENNLVRFGLPAILWGVLLAVAWSRQRQHELPREKLLVWGFGLGLARELFMFSHVSLRILGVAEHGSVYLLISEPLEHALSMASIVVIAGSFLRYILPDEVPLSRRYLKVGLGATGICFLSTAWWWPSYTTANPEIKFHQTWGAWFFHVPISILIVTAIVLLARKRGWLRNVVSVALTFFFLSEALMLFNFATNKAYAHILCPIGNSFRIWAIPLVGYVYLREQSIEKKQAERELKAYRDHLVDLVEERTAELTRAITEAKRLNEQLQGEITERVQAEEALAQLSRQNELILNSAGEGIFGVDLQGNHTFVNPAAARMLGYEAQELVGRPSHATWHHSKPDGSPYPEDECPLHTGYKSGMARRGTDQVFWKKDSASFPVQYTSTPIHEHGELAGAVVVFRDITERKQAEAEITRRNAELAAQNAIAATISQSLDLDTILNAALERTLAVLGMEAGCIFLLEPEGETLTLHAYQGRTASNGSAEYVWQKCLCEDISAQAVSGMKPVILHASDYPTEHRSPFITEEELQILVSTPLVSKGQAVGALTLGARQAGAIPSQELELLTAIGQQIGMAVENARLYQETERAAALEERQRIAAEMHDGLAQTLSYLGLKVDRAAELLQAERVQEVAGEFHQIRNTIGRATQDVRHSIASLQESPRPRQSLQDCLNSIISEFAIDGGPQVELVTRLPAPLFLPPGQTEQVLRVVQEGLLNASRHSQAQHVTVYLGKQGDETEVTIEDDGRGFDPGVPLANGGDHFGLSIMRARAARIGGRVKIDSAPGQGTRVTLTWPLSANTANVKRDDLQHTPDQRSSVLTTVRSKE